MVGNVDIPLRLFCFSSADLRSRKTCPCVFKVSDIKVVMSAMEAREGARISLLLVEGG